jgi:LysR family transcriptional regulator, transcriptional activator of nhaA
MLNYKHLHYFYTVAKTGSIVKAAEKLHLTPQTLSGQISQFEDRLKVSLFRRAGRRLELTEMGRTAQSYAEEIFQIGNELEQVLRSPTDSQSTPFRVGIADVVPKTIAQKLLSPVLNLASPVKLICREDSLDHLLADLALHKLDMVLADKPLPSHIDIKGYSHPLLESEIAFMATADLAQTLNGEFPQCLNHAPLLIPSDESVLRSLLLRWLERHEIQPKFVGEFDDSALMRAFGETGAGVFPMLKASLDSQQALQLVTLGVTSEIIERYFAISVERKVTHPAVRAITEHAQESLRATF